MEKETLILIKRICGYIFMFLGVFLLLCYFLFFSSLISIHGDPAPCSGCVSVPNNIFDFLFISLIIFLILCGYNLQKRNKYIEVDSARRKTRSTILIIFSTLYLISFGILLYNSYRSSQKNKICNETVSRNNAIVENMKRDIQFPLRIDEKTEIVKLEYCGTVAILELNINEELDPIEPTFIDFEALESDSIISLCTNEMVQRVLNENLPLRVRYQFYLNGKLEADNSMKDNLSKETCDNLELGY